MSTVASNNISIKIEITDNSNEVKDAFKNAIARALFAMGEEAETFAKKVILDEDRVDTGNMLNRTTHREGEDFTAIGNDVFYSIYQEIGTNGTNGTNKIAPARFLTRAVTEHTERYKQIVKESLENA